MAIEVNVPGLGKRYFEDDTPHEQIKAAINKELNYGAKEPGLLASIPIGLGRGLTSLGQGLKSVGLQAFGAPGADNAYRQKMLDEKTAYQEGIPGAEGTAPSKRFLGKASEFVGEALPFAAIPGLGGLGTLGRFGASAAISGALGAMSPKLPGESRIPATAISTFLGPVAEFGLPLLATPANKLINAVLGRFRPDVDPTLVQAMDKARIPTSAADYVQNSYINGLDSIANSTPSGMGGWRQNQSNKAQEFLQQGADQLQTAMNNTPYGGAQGLSPIENLANQPFGSPRQYAATEVLKDVKDAKNINDVISASANTKAFRSKLGGDKLYKKANQYFGDEPYTAPNVLETLGSIKAELGQSLDPNSPLIKRINTISDAFNNNERASGNALMQALAGQQSSGPATKFKQLSELTSSLGNDIADHYKGKNSITSSNDVRYLQQLKNAADIDLNNIAQQKSAELGSKKPLIAIENATDYYKNIVGQYSDPKLAAAIANKNTDVLYQQFAKNGTFDGAPEILFKALDKKGRAAVRAGIVKNAIDTALVPETGEISIQKALSSINSKQGAYKTFFQGRDLRELEGMKKVLKVVADASNSARAAQAGSGTMTGHLYNGAYALASGAAGLTVNPLLGMFMFAAPAGIKYLLTNPRGRNYLLAASRLEPQSKAMQRVVNSIGSLMKAGAVQQSSKGASR